MLSGREVCNLYMRDVEISGMATKCSGVTDSPIQQKENEEQCRNRKCGGNENRDCVVLLLFEIPKTREI